MVTALLAACAASRADVPPDSAKTRARADSLSRSGPLLLREGVARRDTSAHRDSLALPPAHSPGLAMLLSALAPGAGQLYNQSYWKIPVVVGLGLYFASTWLDQNRRTADYRQQYAASLLPGSPYAYESAQLLAEREFYKEQRDTFAWYFVILYFVNIADAYVDASLYDFDVGPDLSLRVLPLAPGPAAPAPGLTLRLTF